MNGIYDGSSLHRLQIIRNHLRCRSPTTPHKGSLIFSPTSSKSDGLRNLRTSGVADVEVEPPPPGLEDAFGQLLTPDAIQFIANLTRQFSDSVDRMLKERIRRKIELDLTGALPSFPAADSEARQGDWKIAPVPRRLQNRHLDLGDVSPANTKRFTAALHCQVNGIQTDFDDGHCPTWRNQIQGLFNIYRAVKGTLPGAPAITDAPILMLRPRAWNMVEHNMLVDGKEVPGPLFDFGLLMYHCSADLIAAESGPFFYLSKLEGWSEARLWNDIFCWTQKALNIPQGTIKACVLIENILASFEMDEILYELRQHSLGLNCGIWDYSASFVNKFGHRSDFVLPDRNKYVNMSRHFLSSYMDLVIHTCHKRGAHATGGMAATILKGRERDINVITQVTTTKLKEVLAGVDGFMVYDFRFVPIMNRIFSHTEIENQIERLREDVKITPQDLLQMPSGGVTMEGLKHNVAVGILFIESWLKGEGVYVYCGAVEDSATAEISRSQIWQWIRHRATLEVSGDVITRALVQKLIAQFINSEIASGNRKSQEERHRLETAAEIFEEVVTKRDFPEFLTTYLNQDHTFLSYQRRAQN